MLLFMRASISRKRHFAGALLNLSEQAMASLVTAGSDEQTRAAEAVLDAMKRWRVDLERQARRN